MKSIDEQMLQITKRSEDLKYINKAKKQLIAEGIGIAVCLALIVVTFSFAPNHSGNTIAEASQYGSLIFEAPSAVYVIVGFLAFLLGLFVTLFSKKVHDLKKR